MLSPLRCFYLRTSEVVPLRLHPVITQFCYHLRKKLLDFCKVCATSLEIVFDLWFCAARPRRQDNLRVVDIRLCPKLDHVAR